MVGQQRPRESAAEAEPAHDPVTAVVPAGAAGAAADRELDH
jgi:hypothetical protein